MTTQTLNATGHVCAMIQRPYSRIKTAVAELEIQPAAVINGVDHYSDEQVEAIAAHLNGPTKP